MHTTDLNIHLTASHDVPSAEYSHHSSGLRTNTDTVILKAIREQYPEKNIITTPERGCDLLGYAAAGHALATPVTSPQECLPRKWRMYAAPARRLNGNVGGLVDEVLFGKYQYAWKDHEFILYLVDGRDGDSSFPVVRNNYIVGDGDAASQLILEVGKFTSTLHNEIWVFNKGYWSKDAELWKNVSKSSWDNVILDAEMKQTLIDDVTRFFDSRQTYANLKIAWKRGIIFHGPAGNGKTISIKAMMHTLSQRDKPIPTLYVRTLAGFLPPEYMLGLIFGKARQEAPCFLVFEDLDSIVSDNIRSFFLNEVDGLEDNDGILMVGSTNYLERLDPGISKRPSRFDRKYYFPNPDKEERIKYCEYWQRKLSDNRDIDFPHRLCLAIANITHGFSFAYMQEAFVAALLVIASHQDKPAGNGWNKRKGIRMWEDSSDQIADHTPPKDGNDDEDDLDKFILWREIKKQIKILRQSLDDKENADDKKEKADKKTKTNTFKLGKTNSRRIYRYPLTIPVPASPSRSISRNKAIENFAKIKAVSPTGPTFTESGGESNIQKLHRARETAAMEAESRNNLFNDPLQLDGASAEELLLFYSTSPLGEMGDVELGV